MHNYATSFPSICAPRRTLQQTPNATGTNAVYLPFYTRTMNTTVSVCACMCVSGCQSVSVSQQHIAASHRAELKVVGTHRLKRECILLLFRARCRNPHQPWPGYPLRCVAFVVGCGVAQWKCIVRFTINDSSQPLEHTQNWFNVRAHEGRLANASVRYATSRRVRKTRGGNIICTVLQYSQRIIQVWGLPHRTLEALHNERGLFKLIHILCILHGTTICAIHCAPHNYQAAVLRKNHRPKIDTSLAINSC